MNQTRWLSLSSEGSTGATFKSDDAVNQGEQSMINPHADIPTGSIGSTALANNNIAGSNCLTTKNLDSQSFALAFPVVFTRALGFCMSHAISVISK
jgi:hypothetical protein